jgi:hypothetical protein
MDHFPSRFHDAASPLRNPGTWHFAGDHQHQEADMGTKGEKSKVRAERVDTKCGSIGHMTADEIKDRTIGTDVNVTCPDCGEIHLTPEDAVEAQAKKITATPKFKKIQEEAEPGGGSR